jgi:hypothetical protein
MRMEIRAYKKGDEQDILNLFKLSFGKPMSAEYWNWRFANNPFSDAMQIHLMWEDDVLIGHYAVSPTQFIVSGELAMGALSMTTMTHPEYGGRGIFSALADSLYNQMKEDDYKFVWGFPNVNSHYGFIKNLGWQDTGIVPMLSLGVNALKQVPNCNYNLIPNFDDTIALILKDDAPISINKTKAYLNWRYTQNPSAQYKIIQTEEGATVVYKKILSFQDATKFEVDILEINFLKDFQQLQFLLNAILQEEQNVIKFNLWHSLYDKNYLLLEKMGFKMTLPLTYLGFCGFDKSVNGMSDFRNWKLSMGYSDVF